MSTSPSLPEELVSEYLELIKDSGLLDKDGAFAATRITLDYMGRVLDWASSTGWHPASNNMWFDTNEELPNVTTPQLIQLFFDNQNK